MDEIVRLAGQLGQAIRRHPRYQRLMEADAKVRADKSAAEALEAYNKAAAGIARKEKATEPVEVEEKRDFERLRAQVAGNEAIKAFMQARADYAELMRTMNDTIYGQLAPPESGTGPDQAQNP